MRIKEKLTQLVLDLTKESIKYPRMKTTDVVFMLSKLIDDYFVDGWITGRPDDNGNYYWIIVQDMPIVILVQSVFGYNEFWGKIDGDTFCFKKHQILSYKIVETPKMPNA